jgi:hypothetical protein
MDTENGIVSEVQQVDLGDERLERRAAAVLSRLAQQPRGRLLAAMQGRSELAAAYRLLHHEAVTPEALLATHAQATLARAQGAGRVLCLVDSSFIGYGHRRPVAGLGPHNRGEDNGFFVHPTFAVSTAGLALGTLHWHSWVREAALDKHKTQARRPLEQKESARWLASLRALQNFQAHVHTRLTFVADREADFYELIAAAEHAQIDYLIRAQGDRALPDGRRIGQPPRDTPALGTVRFALAARPARCARTVVQQVWAQRVQLSARRGRGRTAAVPASVVWAWESAPPAGEEPVRWILLTNLPVTTLEQAAQLVDWYRLRWRIEMLFDALKNICRIEEAQLRDAAALKNLCALHLIVAWRLLHLQTVARHQPQLPATTGFTPAELATLARALPHPAPPLQTMGEAIIALARLGGYLARKNDQPPGLKTLARAHQRLCLLVAFLPPGPDQSCV